MTPTKEKAEPQTKNIHQRMHAVMSDVGYIQKENKKVNNQYTFVSHDSVTGKIRPALVQHGIIAITRITNHTQDGDRTVVDIEIDFINIDSPDQIITVPAFGYGVDKQDKGPGKAISYAFKYALLKAFALETGADPERDHIDHSVRITEEQALQIHSLLTENSKDIEKFLSWLQQSRKFNSIEEISTSAFPGIVKQITQSINQQSQST